jgi:hypothetical protein
MKRGHVHYTGAESAVVIGIVRVAVFAIVLGMAGAFLWKYLG